MKKTTASSDIGKEFLKGYLLSLVAEGYMNLSDGPDAILWAIFAKARENLADVLPEIARLVAAQGVRGAASAVSSWMDQVARDVERGGIGDALGKIAHEAADAYHRGAEAQVKRR